MVPSLNDAQRILLELLAESLSKEDMEQLRAMLVQFRYRRLQKKLNDKGGEKGWIQETLDKWYKEHNRTPVRIRFSIPLLNTAKNYYSK